MDIAQICLSDKLKYLHSQFKKCSYISKERIELVSRYFPFDLPYTSSQILSTYTFITRKPTISILFIIVHYFVYYFLQTGKQQQNVTEPPCNMAGMTVVIVLLILILIFISICVIVLCRRKEIRFFGESDMFLQHLIIVNFKQHLFNFLLY